MTATLAAISPQFWWFVSRATGMVATAVLVLSLFWGVLLATRALRTIDRPAWLLAVHRWFSALACIGIAIHLLALVADNYTHFAWKEILVPGGSSWKTTPVALGVVAFYLVLAVQLTSLVMRRLPRRLWRAVHLTSYAAVWLGVVHGSLAGTDASNRVYRIVALAFIVLAVAAAVVRAVMGTTRSQRAAASRSPARAGADGPGRTAAGGAAERRTPVASGR